MIRRHGNRRYIASGEDIPLEKWIVSYRNSLSRKHPEGNVFIRQFYAAGFYEAYDTVLTYAEKMNTEMMWFREKRSCQSFLNHEFPELESLCTYCNRKFNDFEPIPCMHESCRAEFCSRKCLADHLAIRHRVG